MDRYAIGCIFMLIIQCLWHGAIGALIFRNAPDSRVTPGMSLTRLDELVFAIALVIFLFAHVFLVAWLWLVPLKHRRMMHQTDIEYRLAAANKKPSKNGPTSTRAKNNSSAFERIPIDA